MSISQADSAFDQFLRAAMAVLVLVVVLAIVPFTGDPAGDVKVLIYAWGGSLLAAVCVLRAWFLRRPLGKPQILPGAALVLLLLLTIASLTSSHVGNSLVEVSKFASLLLVYFAASQMYHTPRQVQRLMLVTCVAVSLSIGYGFVQRAGLDPFPWDTAGLENPFAEMPGTFGNGNVAAHATIVCVIMAAYLATAAKRMLWCLGFVPLFLAHMHFSNQRGGIVGILAAGLLVILAKLTFRGVKRPIPTIAISLALLAACGVLPAAGAMALMRMRTGVPYPTGKPILLRYHGYAGAARLIMERPFLGYGPGNYVIENPVFWTPFEKEHFAVERKMNQHVHNDALEMGVDAGLPAAGLYLTFLVLGIGYGLFMGLTDPQPARRGLGFAFAAFFCAFTIDGFFGFNMRVPVTALLLFLIAGALEGAWLAPQAGPDAVKRSMPAWLTRGAVLAVAVATAAFQTRVFASECLLHRGKSGLYYKAYANAEQHLKKGEALAPWNWDFPYQRGKAALGQGDLAAAIDHFKRALTCNPNYVMEHIALAHATMRLATAGPADHETTSPHQTLQGRLQTLNSAAAHAQEALALCDVLPEGEDLLGRITSLRATFLQQQAAASGEDLSDRITAAWKEAAQHFIRAIECRGTNQNELYHMLAVAYMGLNDHVGAEDALIRAANADPANDAIWATFAQFARKSGRVHIFRTSVLKTLARFEKDGMEAPPALGALALAWNGHPKPGGIVQATAALAKAAVSNQAAPLKAQNRANLSWAADFLLEELRKPGRLRQETAVALDHLAVVYLTGAVWDKADALFGASWEHLSEGRRIQAARDWASVLNKKGEYGKSTAVLRRALAETDGNLALHYTLARTLVAGGKTEEARREYEAILERYTISARGRVLFQRELDALSSTEN